jgi:hypothetical protein
MLNSLLPEPFQALEQGWRGHLATERDRSAKRQR